jgi:hypothetical protein
MSKQELPNLLSAQNQDDVMQPLLVLRAAELRHRKCGGARPFLGLKEETKKPTKSTSNIRISWESPLSRKLSWTPTSSSTWLR